MEENSGVCVGISTGSPCMKEKNERKKERKRVGVCDPKRRERDNRRYGSELERERGRGRERGTERW